MTTPYHLPKKRGVPKGTRIFFLRDTSLTVATPLGMSRAKLRIRLKWPNVYPCFLHGLAWYCCLFVYLCLMRYCMIFFCLYCLLKSFPNCHCVCHPNNMYAPLFNNFVVVVTMDHRSSLNSDIEWRTHQLIAQSHWIISCWL